MNQQANQGNRTLLIIVFIVVVLAGSAAVWYWGIYKPEQEAKERARQEAIAQAAAEEQRKQAAAQRKANYDQLIENADTEFNNENWQMAYSLYTEASALLSNQQYPKDQLVLVNAKLDELAEIEARKAAGVVETVSSATGRFYVIISSSLDGDLAMDYAVKLQQEGTSVKIIQPYEGNEFFHRVSVGDYDTWDQAVSASASFSSEEGAAWVLKY